MTIGRYQRTNWLIAIIGKTADNRRIPIIGASVVISTNIVLHYKQYITTSNVMIWAKTLKLWLVDFVIS